MNGPSRWINTGSTTSSAHRRRRGADCVDRSRRPSFPSVKDRTRAVRGQRLSDPSRSAPTRWRADPRPKRARLEITHIALASVRRGVTAIEDGVDVHATHTALLRHFQERVQVLLMAVDAAVGQKTDQMECALRTHAIHRLDQHRVGKQRAVLDGAVDAHDVLVHDASRSEIEVADFAVAHLTVGKTDPRTRGFDQRVRIFLPQPVDHRRFGQTNRVGVAPFAPTPTIHDDEQDLLVTRVHRLPPPPLPRRACSKRARFSDAARLSGSRRSASLNSRSASSKRCVMA